MKIDLIATEIEFTRFSIIYHVKANDTFFEDLVVVSPDDIVNKDLILKVTSVSPKSMKVVYTPSNCIPEFYQAIFDRTIHDISEYQVERKYIYEVGEVVGHVLLKKD